MKVAIEYPEPMVGIDHIGIGLTTARFDQLDTNVTYLNGFGFQDLIREDPLEALQIIKTEAIEIIVAMASMTPRFELASGAERFVYNQNNPDAFNHLRSVLRQRVAPVPLQQDVHVEFVVAPVYDQPVRNLSFSRTTFTVASE